jgi:hypothetical protein
VVTDDVVVVVVLEVLLVGLKGFCWVVAPETAVSSKAAAANEKSLAACFICLFSNPATILSTSGGNASEKRLTEGPAGAAFLPPQPDTPS